LRYDIYIYIYIYIYMSLGFKRLNLGRFGRGYVPVARQNAE